MMWFRSLGTIGLLALSACGGSATSPAPPVTIAAPLQYLAQSRGCDGNAETPLGTPDAWTCLRYDQGGYQVEQSFLRPDGASAETIWSYPPFGPFVAANGDGGELYQLDAGPGAAVYITETQDGGKPGVLQRFGNPRWWAFDKYVPACSAGWRSSPEGLGRACHQTITFPGTPAPITADTIVSEHYALPGQQGPMERAFYGLGWSRLAWMAFASGCAPVDPARAPPISAFDTAPDGLTKCDERLNTNIVPADGSLSGQSFGWPPS